MLGTDDNCNGLLRLLGLLWLHVRLFGSREMRILKVMQSRWNRCMCNSGTRDSSNGCSQGLSVQALGVVRLENLYASSASLRLWHNDRECALLVVDCQEWSVALFGDLGQSDMVVHLVLHQIPHANTLTRKGDEVAVHESNAR